MSTQPETHGIDKKTMNNQDQTTTQTKTPDNTKNLLRLVEAGLNSPKVSPKTNVGLVLTE